jgi:hypothetical protein
MLIGFNKYGIGGTTGSALETGDCGKEMEKRED